MLNSTNLTLNKAALITINNNFFNFQLKKIKYI